MQVEETEYEEEEGVEEEEGEEEEAGGEEAEEADPASAVAEVPGTTDPDYVDYEEKEDLYATGGGGVGPAALEAWEEEGDILPEGITKL